MNKQGGGKHTMKNIQLQTVSRHFRLAPLAGGVYAAIHASGGWAISNAGIIDLGDRTLVFDTFLTPHAAQDLRAVAEELTGRPVSAVINSHYHNDHIWGNQAFGPDTDVISTVETRRLIMTEGMKEYDWYRDNSAAQLESLQSQFQAKQDEGQRQQMSLWISYYQGIIEAMPTLTVRLPNVTFAERLNLYGAQRSAELIAYSGGHTENDTVLYLPAEGIVFMSDLLFVGCHPYLADGDPEEILHTLEAIRGLAPQTLVPGHGPIGTPDALSLMGEYIVELEKLARKMVEAGEPKEKIAETAIPAPFDLWEYPTFFAANLRFLYEHLSSK